MKAEASRAHAEEDTGVLGAINWGQLLISK